MISIGVDPGWAKCGVAILETEDGERFSLAESFVISPSSLEFPKLWEAIGKNYTPETIGVERFVSYRGTFSSASEKILMVIGAIMALAPVTPSTFRAIDWKNYLLYHFDLTPENGKLDKTFSFLAAEKICGKRPRTDHEADAICIAYCAYKASTLGTPGNGVA